MIEIPTPDDWHVHLRADEMLEAVVGYSARRFRYALVMPNLRPPITTTSAAIDYRDRIMGVAPRDTGFHPIMALYLTPEVSLDDLRRGADEGIVAGVKYYPAGATTNSDGGGSSLSDFRGLLEGMAEAGVRLLVHAEATDPSLDIFDREAAFLEHELAPLCAAVPELRVTVEHVSTRAGVEFVGAHPRTAATITPHHLARQRTDLLADGMRPDLFCKPVINSADDRDALIEAATGGVGPFCLGTDSAPHPTTAKYGPRAAAGIFNAAYGLEVVAEVFHQAGRLDRMGAFVSGNGCAAYGVETPETTLTLTREPVEVERDTQLETEAGDQVVLFGAEEAARWTIS
ncbi:MAG: dihydroorotase [Actinomycetia bacterium]|nr:dihydroorotase [Actinomycetes bacterium]MCP4087010.1 dihydroorotase [Actinomycetes bacterium]